MKVRKFHSHCFSKIVPLHIHEVISLLHPPTPALTQNVWTEDVIVITKATKTNQLIVYAKMGNYSRLQNTFGVDIQILRSETFTHSIQ